MSADRSEVAPIQTRTGTGRQIVAGALFLVAVALVAFLGSLATMPNTEGWYAEATKAPWSPPNSVFGPVWSVLYVLIALAGWLIWRAGFRPGEPNAARKTLALYITQLALNSLWTPVFFAGYPLIGDVAWWIALVIILALIVSVIWLAVDAAKWSQAAMWIMIPYLLWLMFATSLNLAIIVLN